MAGRAGRRGLDPTGTVIIVANDELPEVFFVPPYDVISIDRTYSANYAPDDDAWQPRKTVLPIQVDLQHDFESAPGRGTKSRRNDQTQLFRERHTETLTRSAKAGH